MTNKIDKIADESLVNLGIFPGIGNPQSEEYSPVYDLIMRLAKKHGYQTAEVLTWPGQNQAVSASSH